MKKVGGNRQFAEMKLKKKRLLQLLGCFFLILFSIACQEKKTSVPQSELTFEGKVQLYDQYGRWLNDHSGIQINLITQGENIEFITATEGDFNIPFGGKLDRLEFSKAGFAKRVVENPDVDYYQGRIFRLSEISSMEVKNLEITQNDCDGVECMLLVFQVDHFYTGGREKRYFELQINQGETIINQLRFFVFQESFGLISTVTRLSETAALVEVPVFYSSNTDELPTGIPLEFRLFGATANTFHLDFLVDEMDYTFNEQFGIDTLVIQ